MLDFFVSIHNSCFSDSFTNLLCLESIGLVSRTLFGVDVLSARDTLEIVAFSCTTDSLGDRHSTAS